MSAPPVATSARRIVVFDLDGTITRRDTLLPYLLGWLRRHPARQWRSWALPGPLLRFLFDRDRGRLKSALIRIVLGGAARGEVAAWSRDFVATLDARRFCPGALAAIAQHRQAGDRLVLLSASVDLYVPMLAARLGFDEVICTGVAWNGDRLDGALTTVNRRGTEKLHCVQELRARHPGAVLAACADSRSDLVHLAAVEEPLLVNAGWRTRRRAGRLGIRAMDWRR
ncbi:MAG: HAD-IB family phosphatase [Gammaproteobacteria bacterium]|nr:HAD-IB family phosphatase [Gammaproteobacteria bacterium]